VGQINLPDNWIDEKRELQRQIDELRAAVGLSSATISRGGLTIKGGAFFTMRDASGNLVAYIGPDPGGGPSQVFQLFRPGVGALLTTQQDATSGRYFAALHDYLGNTILADDVQTGGLARPYLEHPMYPAQTSSWQATSSASFVDLWMGESEFQHPKLDWAIGVSDAGASGQVRITVDGTQVGPTFNYTAGSPTYFAGRAAHGATLNNSHLLRIQALKTSGAGTIVCAPLHLRGVQS
jgi:hypothetical protein